MILYTLAHTQFSSSKKLQLLPTLLGMTSINHENKHFLLQRKEYCTLICKESSADLQRFHWLVKQESKTASFRNHYQSNRIDSCGPHPQLRSPKYGKKKKKYLQRRSNCIRCPYAAREHRRIFPWCILPHAATRWQEPECAQVTGRARTIMTKRFGCKGHTSPKL